IYKTDAESLREFGRRREATFRTNLASRARITASNVRANHRSFGAQNLIDGNRETFWATDDTARTAEVLFEFPAPVTFDVVRIREALSLGQRVRAFSVEAADEAGSWKPVASEASIGNCRLVRLNNKVTSARVKLAVTRAAACPALSEFGLYLGA
ncbi:MAG TPA: discoidin domain-containing protein, partial [Candidatus Acidoferrales bacterium]|nr:discoidin domain-containing protein [Candidatus Acidoferrales bacterium]